MGFLDWLRVIVLGIIEGVTEWLPVSSTGHLILLNRLWPGNSTVFTDAFTSIFDVIIQLGAILAVVSVFFHKLNPISSYKTDAQKRNTWQLWLKIIVGVLPAAVVGFFLDDLMDKYLYNWVTVAITLIFYGVVFIVLEKRYSDRNVTITRFSQLSLRTALFIGLFQVLSLIPGTSRSGITIIGALILGCSRFIATEFTFYLAVPVMLGASGLKLVKYLFVRHMSISGTQAAALFVAMAVAYVVSIFVIRFLISYVKRHDFSPFGVYRIVLGLVVLLVFGLLL
ncbi:MAG: undecaprenyl-diphosphate phosphatase [Lachnospiraceae bacterium]|nr:undecaprenyl-diphosphate phosphatase [Lachnospiraceae bacterium]